MKRTLYARMGRLARPTLTNKTCRIIHDVRIIETRNGRMTTTRHDHFWLEWYDTDACIAAGIMPDARFKAEFAAWDTYRRKDGVLRVKPVQLRGIIRA